jgi:hypothetical protein
MGHPNKSKKNSNKKLYGSKKGDRKKLTSSRLGRARLNAPLTPNFVISYIILYGSRSGERGGSQTVRL